MNRISTRTDIVVCIAVLLCAPALMAEEADSASKTDLKAKTVLEEVIAYYGGLNTLVVEATLNVKDKSNDEERDLSNTFSIALRRPNHVALTAAGDAVAMRAVSDGKTLTLYDTEQNQYMLQDAAEKPATIVGRVGPGILRVGTMLMAEPLREKPYGTLMNYVTGQHYVGEEEINGRPHHHIKIYHEEIDWEMWVDAGDKPLVSKVKVDVSKVLEQAKVEDVSIDMSVSYKGWVANGDIADNTFVFTPPEGAKKIERQKPPASASALEGKPAPTFKLKLLDGGSMDLAAHKGKDIVILDFWASWCGPCRKAMPIYIKVAEKFKDKGVVFYGVNLRETPEVASGFLKKMNMSCTVALDTDGEAANAYSVVSIPTSVIIDKEGIVRKVHIGLSENLEETLEKELEEMLKGS